MLSLLRQPDAAYGATEQSAFRFEENLTNDVKYEYVVEGNSAKVIVYPSGSPVKYLKLRFCGDLQNVEKVFGDQWERVGHGAQFSYLEWKAVMPFRPLPWFCHIISDKKVDSYGVKTGADAFVFFQVDYDGITLFINLCNGNDGTDLQQPLVACEVVQREGAEGEDPYLAAQAFAKQMCEKPVLPKQPIFGVNNWYWAYGNISHESVMKETDYLMRVTRGCKHRPYIIIDDGWQKYRDDPVSYPNPGAPWVGNSRFPDLKHTVDCIHEKGANAGIWFRPLLSLDPIPVAEAQLCEMNKAYVLDPSHPYTLEYVEKVVHTFTQEWGFDLVKHDFTVIDTTGHYNFSADYFDHILCKPDRKFFDKTKTTATILKNLYKAIQKGAGDKEIIACSTIGHLTAGIHSIYRTGADTSGRCFEWTRRDGGNSLMRLPLNKSFYLCDPDCAAFTDKVKFEPNLDFMEMCALTGQAVLASITPDLLTEEQIEKVNAIFRLADEGKGDYRIVGFDKTSCPERFVSADGKTEKRFRWSSVYNGSRIVLTWYD